MGTTTATYREVRFLIEEELTQVYVLLVCGGDWMLGINGWHHKTFPTSVSVVDIVNGFATDDGDPLMWPQQAPPTKRQAKDSDAKQ